MIARARIALDVAGEERHLLDLSAKEIIEVAGEGPDWGAAKAACEIPPGALKLAWFRDE